jgi:hypothetical protein
MWTISLSQTHECGNWDLGRAIPRKGTHKWDLRCSADGARRERGGGRIQIRRQLRTSGNLPIYSLYTLWHFVCSIGNLWKTLRFSTLIFLIFASPTRKVLPWLKNNYKRTFFAEAVLMNCNVRREFET